jgi:2-C-methyl-D-erythritol 4-phosphate cytidylyltransferase
LNKVDGGIAVVLVAGGRGQRYQAGEGLPKQFLKLAGEPMFIWALRAFCDHRHVTEVVLVVVPDLLKAFKDHIEQYLGQYSEKISFTDGGLTRQSSVHLGLEFLDRQKTHPKHVIIHDAARPFVGQEEINRIISALDETSGCVLAIPVADTVKIVKDQLVIATIDRHSLFLMQTPQAAKFTTLLEAYRRLQKDGVETTDDAEALERIQVPVRVIPGSPRNFKITNAEDFALAQAVARLIKSESGPVRHYM